MTVSSYRKVSKSIKPTEAAPVSHSQQSPKSSTLPILGPQILDRQTLLCCLALVAAVFVFYSSVLRNQFLVYDDNLYISENSHVKDGLTWQTVKWAFTSYDESNWHPLTWLSHALDAELFGINPAGHHAVNVLLHALNAVLLFLLLQSVTGFRWRSLMVAALFALHPINVESVAWAAERKNVLCTTFFLLALYAYDSYARAPEVRIKSGCYAAVIGFFALALMAKPQVITFPFLLLLWDYWPLGRITLEKSAATRSPMRLNSELLWEKTPLLLLSAVSAVITMQAQRAGGAVRDLSRVGMLLRIENAVVAYVRYLGKMFWPAKLVALYPHPTRLYPAWQVGAAASLLILITFLVLRAREHRYLAVGWFWFLGSLVPMIGLVQVGEQALADRYAYISFIGLFVMVVWLLADLAQRQTIFAHRISPRWLAVPAVCCLLVLGVLTYRQVRYWHDTESFWRRTLALTQDNFVAHKGLAGLLYGQGKHDEALSQVRAALAIKPDDSTGNLILGDYERARGNVTGAIDRYQFAAQHTSSLVIRAKAYANLGYTCRQIGQPAQAKQSFEMSLKAMPNQPTIMVQLGLINQLGGDAPTAVRYFSHAMALQPTDVGLLLLANALLEEGKTSESNAILDRAVRMSKNIDAAQKQAQSLLDEPDWK
jgi:protein O-mannosyl-transferase